ncbi:hypothetical protein ACX0G9_14725 [Flavitalea flava]
MHSSTISKLSVRTGLIICLFMVILSSCYKSPVLTPGTANILYALPQGNQPYDKDIVDFYNTYGTFILYKWTAADFGYGVTNAVFFNQIQAFPADTNYIQQGLHFLHANLLDVYPIAFVKQTIPWRILLAGEIDSIAVINSNTVYAPPTYDTTHNISVTAVSGQHQITLGQVDSIMPLLTPAQVAKARGWLNRAYWQQAISNKVVEMPPSFDAVTNYAILNSSNHLRLGALYYRTDGSTNDATSDFLDYIQMITSTPFQQISDTWFTPQTDTNGLIRIKYNIIVQYYQANFGIDLQAIGDLP